MSSMFENADGSRRTYSSLSTDEKWRYHTHCYAFRMVYLGMPETVRSWEGDPSGRWFDADMIAAEVSRLQRQKEKQDGSAHRRVHPDDPREDPHVKAQRAEWIEKKGYPTWEACLDAMWKDAEDHPHPITGQPNAVRALLRSGLLDFSNQWRDRIVQQRMKWEAERKAQQEIEKLQSKLKGLQTPYSPLASYPKDPT